MKYLVVFYSRTGITRLVGEKLAQVLDCTMEEIIDTKKRKGPIGYVASGRDAIKKSLTKLEPQMNDPKDFDLVIIGTPIWGWSVSTPVRTYLENNKGKFKKVAFFSTMGGDGDKKAYKTMSEICNCEPIAKLSLLTKQVLKDKNEKRFKKFIDKVK